MASGVMVMRREHAHLVGDPEAAARIPAAGVSVSPGPRSCPSAPTTGRLYADHAARSMAKLTDGESRDHRSIRLAAARARSRASVGVLASAVTWPIFLPGRVSVLP